MRPFAYHDLIEAFAEDGCPVCRLALRAVRRYLDALLYEFSTDPETHRAFRDGRGLCNAHSWQLTEIMGGALSTAVLFRSALREVQHLTDAPNSTPRKQADRLAPRCACPACQRLRDSEAACLEVFPRYFEEPAFRSAWHASQGVCLPHLRLILPKLTAEQAARLLADQKAVWKRLQADLEAFQRNYQAEHSSEPLSVAEATSWQRVIAMLTGECGMFGLED
jgi:hypothetical protein